MRTLFLLFLLALVATPRQTFAQNETAAADPAWYCPPCDSQCDDLAFAQDGQCPHCGMDLLLQTSEQRKTTMKKLTVAVYLQDGVEILDFAGPVEVFSYAGFHVYTVSRTKDPIVSQGIVRILPDYSIEDCPQPDIIAFFGGNSARATSHPEVIDWVGRISAEADQVFTVCTGAFFPAKAGLLDDLTVTTFHDAIDDLQALLPDGKVLRNVRWVDNGRILTTAGISAGIDGALRLVSRLLGKEAAERIAREMEYDKWTPEDGLVIDDE